MVSRCVNVVLKQLSFVSCSKSLLNFCTIDAKTLLQKRYRSKNEFFKNNLPITLFVFIYYIFLNDQSLKKQFYMMLLLCKLLENCTFRNSNVTSKQFDREPFSWDIIWTVVIGVRCPVNLNIIIRIKKPTTTTVLT